MTTANAATAEPWLAALHASSDRLASAVGDLSEEELTRPSFAGQWSIADVLSHLGSGAQISAGLVERGLAGGTQPPRREELAPVWDHWNALRPADQRARWIEADSRHLRMLDELGGEERAALRVPYFAGLMDLATYAGYRLSEQSVHAWDVQVALDPGIVIPPAEAALLWERIDVVATRFREGAVLARLAPASITVNRTDSPGGATLLLASELHIYPCAPADPTATLTGTTEALVRLIYGRNRPGLDGLSASGSVDVNELRALFPGY